MFCLKVSHDCHVHRTKINENFGQLLFKCSVNPAQEVDSDSPKPTYLHSKPTIHLHVPSANEFNVFGFEWFQVIGRSCLLCVLNKRNCIKDENAL